MKKTISVFLTMLLIFCSFSFLLPVYAAAPEDTLDLSQYSLEGYRSYVRGGIPRSAAGF